MTGIKTNQIRFDLEATIIMPAEVELAECQTEGVPVLTWNEEKPVHTWNSDNSVLTWDTEAPKWSTGIPVSGCLVEFMSLVDASPEEVLAFARRRGVLGIWPHPSRHGNEPELYYSEPISVYQQCARQATALMSIAKKLRSGKPVQTKLEWDAADTLPMNDNIYAVMKGRPHYKARVILEQQYQLLSYLVSRWLKAAHIRLMVEAPDYLEFDDEAAVLPFKSYLTFGKWSDGRDWDERMLEAPKQVCASDMDIPSRYQRPSPLFAVLAVQLEQAIILPPDVYFCSYCGKPYKHDPSKGNKPRADKNNSWCKPECKAAYMQTYSREWKRNKAKQQQVEIAPSCPPDTL